MNSSFNSPKKKNATNKINLLKSFSFIDFECLKGLDAHLQEYNELFSIPTQEPENQRGVLLLETPLEPKEVLHLYSAQYQRRDWGTPSVGKQTPKIQITHPGKKKTAPKKQSSPFSNSTYMTSMRLTERLWHYLDDQKVIQGPFTTLEMDNWYNQGYLPEDLMISFMNRDLKNFFRIDLLHVCNLNKKLFADQDTIQFLQQSREEIFSRRQFSQDSQEFIKTDFFHKDILLESSNVDIFPIYSTGQLTDEVIIQQEDLKGNEGEQQWKSEQILLNYKQLEDNRDLSQNTIQYEKNLKIEQKVEENRKENCQSNLVVKEQDEFSQVIQRSGEIQQQSGNKAVKNGSNIYLEDQVYVPKNQMEEKQKDSQEYISSQKDNQIKSVYTYVPQNSLANSNDKHSDGSAASTPNKEEFCSENTDTSSKGQKNQQFFQNSSCQQSFEEYLKSQETNLFYKTKLKQQTDKSSSYQKNKHNNKKLNTTAPLNSFQSVQKREKDQPFG